MIQNSCTYKCIRLLLRIVKQAQDSELPVYLLHESIPTQVCNMNVYISVHVHVFEQEFPLFIRTVKHVLYAKILRKDSLSVQVSYHTVLSNSSFWMAWHGLA